MGYRCMEIERRAIANIGGYRVIETRIIKNSGPVEVFYTIRNQAGAAIGDRFSTPQEPIDLLRTLLDGVSPNKSQKDCLPNNNH